QQRKNLRPRQRRLLGCRTGGLRRGRKYTDQDQQDDSGHCMSSHTYLRKMSGKGTAHYTSIRWQKLSQLKAAPDCPNLIIPHCQQHTARVRSEALECGRSSYRFPTSVHATNVPRGRKSKAV